MALKTALITGITGQDGSYLAELLLEKGYRVVGMVRRTSTEGVERIRHILDQVELQQGDLLDQLSLISLIEATKPDEVYNLAAQSFVPASWRQPVLTAEFTSPRRHSAAGGRSPGQSEDPLLPGLEQRDVWQGSEEPSE